MDDNNDDDKNDVNQEVNIMKQKQQQSIHSSNR